MKTLILNLCLFVLPLLGTLSPATFADERAQWQSPDKMLRSLAAKVECTDNIVTLVLPAAGNRFFYYVKDEEPRLTEYGQRLVLRVGPPLNLYSRHTTMKITLIAREEKGLLLIERLDDMRSFGGGLIRSLSAATLTDSMGLIPVPEAQGREFHHHAAKLPGEK
ncbi:MAG: hypothetical protein ACR2OZ_18475 [Verrucomicrobiales bacterium]